MKYLKMLLYENDELSLTRVIVAPHAGGRGLKYICFRGITFSL